MKQGKIWVAYADLELRNGLFPRVESIFARCLRNSTSVDLWAFYITYIRRMNKIEGVDVDKAKTSRIVISKSYEFCLLHVGQDRFSGSLWSEYIAFLKSSDVSCPPFLPLEFSVVNAWCVCWQSSGTWEAQQNMDNVRKAYQRAVGVPLNNVEQIWSEYNHWEQQLNKVTVSLTFASLTSGTQLHPGQRRPVLDPRFCIKESFHALLACETDATTLLFEESLTPSRASSPPSLPFTRCCRWLAARCTTPNADCNTCLPPFVLDPRVCFAPHICYSLTHRPRDSLASEAPLT